MNNLKYYLARQRGLEPDEATDEANAPDDTPDAADDTPDGPEYSPAALAPDDSAAELKTQGPEAPPPPVQTSAPPTPAPEPAALSSQLAEALKRSRTRSPMPAAIDNEALQKSMEGDDRAGKDAQLTETLRAAFARQTPRQVDSGKSSAGTQVLLKKQQEFQHGDEQDRANSLREALLLSKAGKTAVPAITPYQQEELKLRKEGIDRSAEQKRGALDDRKKLLLSMYPERKAEIDALNDLGNAESLQRTLDSRGAASAAMEHSDQAAAVARTEREREAREASARELQKQKDLEEWKATHKQPTAEQLAQLEGIEKSDEVLSTFKDSLNGVQSATGKLAATFPGVAGALGMKGADFPAARHGAAALLARGIEGGTAKPGTVEIIESMLPTQTDVGSGTDEKKMEQVRKYIEDNRQAFFRAAKMGGTQLQQAPEKLPVGETVWMRNKRTNERKPMSRARAQQILGAPGGDQFEVYDARP